MKSFSSIKYKLISLTHEQSKLEVDFNNEDMKKVRLSPTTTIKRLVVFPIIEERLLGSSTIAGSVYTAQAIFYDFPSWAIPMMKIVPIITGVNYGTPTFSQLVSLNHYHLWEKIDNNYKLYIVFWTSNDSYYGSLFIEINAYFFDLNLYINTL
jgi:hypothetical protein